MNKKNSSKDSKPNRGRKDNKKLEDKSGPEFKDKVVKITRCSKVVKGGRRFSFSSLVVVGDGNGQIGVGIGKAKEVPECIRKGNENAKSNLLNVTLKGNTIPYQVRGKADGGEVVLVPASPGTGVIAGGGVRAVLEAAGIKDVLSKSLGSNNHHAMVNATVAALTKLRSLDDIKKTRFTN